jgi:hypothetical protein
MTCAGWYLGWYSSCRLTFRPRSGFSVSAVLFFVFTYFNKRLTFAGKSWKFFYDFFLPPTTNKTFIVAGSRTVKCFMTCEFLACENLNKSKLFLHKKIHMQIVALVFMNLRCLNSFTVCFRPYWLLIAL